jgi:hypothetical protein
MAAPLSQPALPTRRAVRRGRGVQSSWPSAAEIVVPPTVRTVIINGESDKITTADDARALQARFRSLGLPARSTRLSSAAAHSERGRASNCLCSQTVLRTGVLLATPEVRKVF